MIKHWGRRLAALAALAYLTVFAVYTVHSENALLDDNSRPTLIVEDSASSGSIIRVKGDVVTGSMLVSGLATAACGTREIKKYAVPAASDSGSNLLGTSTSTMVFIQNESLGDVYFAENTAAATSTGMLIGPRGNFGMAAAGIRQIHIYNNQAATATVSVLYCY